MTVFRMRKETRGPKEQARHAKIGNLLQASNVAFPTENLT